VTLLLSTLRGRDSRLPPKIDDGARARTEALVSKEFRRRRLDDEARVRMEALSVRRLFAVAVLYVAGWPPLECPATCEGIAEGGDVGYWWVKWVWPVVIVGVGWWVLFVPPIIFEGAADWMVVRVVVKERTEGAGDENVLPSPPPRPLEPKVPPAVVHVPAFECSASEWIVSRLVETVGAADLLQCLVTC